MRAFLLPLLAAAALLGGCVTAPSTPPAPKGMVSAADPRAAEAGVEMLRKGGSAADAALATLLALTVVEPQSSGIGGGGFLVYHDGRPDPQTYDGRETAPAAANELWFFKDRQPMSTVEAIPGGRSVGVPGNLRMMALAHRDQGRLPWKTLFEPAIRLAREGFAISPRLNRALGTYRETGQLSAEGRRLFYAGSGEPLPVGTVVRNPALAEFLQRLAVHGPDSFYVGPNAQGIVATVNGSSRNPSRMSKGDLASYDAKLREPVCPAYRGYRICGMGPPSSGGLAVATILKQLERFELHKLGPASPRSWHLIAESMRLAFADRDRYLADPDFVKVPMTGLTNPAYMAARSALISPDRAMVKAEAGTPLGAPRLASGSEILENGTSHFVAVDRWGEVASLTSTIESAFGSGLMVNGYYLNNELTDFNIVPNLDNDWVANRVQGGKRPRSSMAPTIVLGPDGKVRLAVGAAGGATIIAQVAKTIIGVLDWGMTAEQAIAAPVLFAPAGETVYLEEGSSLWAMAPALRALGHADLKPRTGFKANAIEWRDGRWMGAADPRSEGVAISQ